MAELTKKKQRTIDRALDRLFSAGSFLVPQSMKDFACNNILVRTLRLSGQRTVLLTDAGLTQMRKICDTIHEADIFDGLTAYSDVSKAFRHILEDLLSRGMRPDNAAELVDLVRDRLNAEIGNYTYVVPLFGVKIDGTDAVDLGSMRIVRSPLPYLESVGVKYDYADLPRIIEAAKHYLWFIGFAKGTPMVSQGKFRELAELATGMLAIAAASMYERGASRFRIGIVMSPEEGHAHGPASWLSWCDSNLKLTAHNKLIGSQQFKIDSDTLAQFAASGVFARAFEIFESNSRTQLEDAITKGIYWFSNAHRDAAPVMRLIKYWSCIETFFSADNKDITRSVSVGLANVLVYGGYNYVPEAEYFSLKKRVAKLYDARSRAVHGAVYRHITDRNVDELSQWAAWMLINMISLVERGYTKTSQIKAIADRLDEKLEGKRQ
jgi:hypothetical protein